MFPRISQIALIFSLNLKTKIICRNVTFFRLGKKEIFGFKYVKSTRIFNIKFYKMNLQNPRNPRESSTSYFAILNLRNPRNLRENCFKRICVNP